MTRERTTGGRYKNTGGIKNVPNDDVAPEDKYFMIQGYDQVFTFERKYSVGSMRSCCEGCWVYDHLKRSRGKLCGRIDCVDMKNISYIYKVIEAE